jgi:chorismate dehydratase
LNCLPIYYGLVNGKGILDLDLVKGTPTELNALLLNQGLDISPVSSIEYARNHDRLLLLPGPTVSCRGAVRSILLVSKCPITQLHGEPVGLTSSSATSHVLLRILLQRLYRVAPTYFTFDEDLEAALRRGRAALLIGDAALRHLASNEGLYVYDLGEEWFGLTGEGMVFAVWAARREFASAHPELLAHTWRLFQESIEFCRENLVAIAADAARWEVFSAPFLEEYFRSLTFDFGSELRRGLMRFYQEASLLGDIPAVPSLDFFCAEEVVHNQHTGRR